MAWGSPRPARSGQKTCNAGGYRIVGLLMLSGRGPLTATSVRGVVSRGLRRVWLWGVIWGFYYGWGWGAGGGRGGRGLGAWRWPPWRGAGAGAVRGGGWPGSFSLYVVQAGSARPRRGRAVAPRRVH